MYFSYYDTSTLPPRPLLPFLFSPFSSSSFLGIYQVSSMLPFYNLKSILKGKHPYYSHCADWETGVQKASKNFWSLYLTSIFPKE